MGERGWRYGRAARFALVASSVLFAATASRAATILGVRLGGDSAATRIVVDADGPLSTPALNRADHATMILTFRAASAEAATGTGRGLIKTWTFSAAQGTERLRLALSAAAEVTRRFTMPPSATNPNYRYVIDLAPNTRTPLAVAEVEPITAFRVAPIAVAPPRLDVDFALETAPMIVPAFRRDDLSARQAPPARSRHRLKVIVVDAGHGGHDSGALGATRQEKEVTLAAAQALKARLDRSGRYRVVLTRDSDIFVPLAARVRIAREGGADLFISLHADSAGADSSTHGASVYTLSDSGGGRVHYVLGHDEWFAKVANRRDPGVSQILLDLTQRNTRNRSATFADLLLDRLLGKVDLLPRGHRDAGYFVLLAPDVPAALLEMGFITNTEDESRLADPAQRARMMDAVAAAIDDYFAEGRTLAAR